MKRLLCLLILCVVTQFAFGQPGKEPTGSEIASKSAKARLDTANSASAAKDLKKVKVTPAVASSAAGMKDLETGQTIGVLETAGNVDHVPNGKHNVYVAKVNNVWQAYAESGGKITAKAKSVRVESGGGRKKPEIEFNLTIIIRWGGLTIYIHW